MSKDEAIAVLKYGDSDLILMHVSGSYRVFILPEELQGKLNAFERDSIIKELITSMLVER